MSGLHDPPLGESDTRSKLIDPAIHARGWTEEHIRREETAGAIEIIDGKPRRRSKGRVDYTLRVKVSNGDQPVALGVIETKAENLPPGHGLDPKTRIQRADAFFYKHAAWLAGLPATAANTLEAIVTQFGTAGTDGLESPDIFNLPEVRKAGGKDGPIKALREIGKPAAVLLDTKARLFAA